MTSKIYTRNIFVPDPTPQSGLLDAKTSRVSTRNNMGAMIPDSISMGPWNLRIGKATVKSFDLLIWLQARLSWVVR